MLELLADNYLESLNTLTPYLIVVEELLLPWQQTTHSHDLILFPWGSHGKVTAEPISYGQVCLLPQQTTHSHGLFYSPRGSHGKVTAESISWGQVYMSINARRCGSMSEEESYIHPSTSFEQWHKDAMRWKIEKMISRQSPGIELKSSWLESPVFNYSWYTTSGSDKFIKHT